MLKKAGFLSAILISCLGAYSFVFSGSLVFDPDIAYVGSLSDMILVDHPELSSTILIYRAENDISQAQVVSSCDISSRFVESYKTLYFFRVDYSNAPECKNENVVLKIDQKKSLGTLARLNLHSSSSLLNMLLDFSDADLEQKQASYHQKMKQNALYKNYSGKELGKYFRFAKGQRNYLEAQEYIKWLHTILQARSEKYISPVPGYSVQKNPSKVPNAARPYRAAYTDGIHHGWDIDAPFGTPVVALDDGIILRVRDNFSDADFENIVYGDDLSYEQELKNLDILRGNQVWLKTMKGEVVFYSHLEDVSKQLKVGQFVEQGTYFGTVGISGVPGVGYEDYHLHFDIKIPPYTDGMQGQYTDMDYMKWPWTGKGQSQEAVYALIEEIFE